MFTLITAVLLLVTVQGQQIFENELSVSLKPPPPPSAPAAPLQKNDFTDVQFIPDVLPPAPVQQPSPPAPKQLAHHAVLFNSEQESKLPPNLLNPFYKDPRIADVLAKQSWFAPGENQVVDRESEKIPRDKIYYALKSAGLLRRRRSIFPKVLRY